MSYGKSEKPTTLPARFTPGFVWDMDRRSSEALGVLADIEELWNSLGGVENLSTQQRWLCERAIFMRRRCLEYESWIMAGPELRKGEAPMDAGTYTNFANVLQAYLKKLGLERKARTVRRLHDVMGARKGETVDNPPQ